MFKNRPRYLSPRALGLFFLIPGLLGGVFSLLSGTFAGAALGFCGFAVLFGLIMVCLPFPVAKP